jgi:hypothetical protein
MRACVVVLLTASAEEGGFGLLGTCNGSVSVSGVQCNAAEQGQHSSCCTVVCCAVPYRALCRETWYSLSYKSRLFHSLPGNSATEMERTGCETGRVGVASVPDTGQETPPLPLPPALTPGTTHDSIVQTTQSVLFACTCVCNVIGSVGMWGWDSVGVCECVSVSIEMGAGAGGSVSKAECE